MILVLLISTHGRQNGLCVHREAKVYRSPRDRRDRCDQDELSAGERERRQIELAHKRKANHKAGKYLVKGVR